MRLPPSLLPLVALVGCVTPAGLVADPAATPDEDTTAPEASSRFRADAEGWSATVPALRMKGRFDADGARFEDERGGTLTLRTVGWGREGALAPILGAAAVADVGSDLERLSFAGTGASEWWRSLDAGFAQGFTLGAAPDGEGPVVLDLYVDGASVAAWASGDGADLVRDDGSVWRYAGIHAWDADGTALPAWIEGEGDTLRLLVDDTGARWPVTVDPVVTTAASTFLGSEADAWFGTSIAGGDVNGDGYDDLVVSAYRISYRGAVYVYHGSSTGFGATPNATLYPATSGGSYEFGWQVATGDFDADGYADVAVSEPYYNKGTVYVFEGSATGTRTAASVLLSGTTTGEQKGFGLAVGDWNGDGYDDLVATNIYRASYGAADVHYGGADGLSTTITTTLTGGSFEYIGYAAASAGDTNADGYDDFVTGHYQGSSYYGRAFVFRGASTGLAQTRVTSITGPLYDNFFGRTVGGLGDVNGDGYDDIGVAAPSSDIPHDGSGSLYVYHGSASGVGTTADATLYGLGYDDRFGWSMDGAGDTNGDGYDDVIVGAIYATGASYANGAAYVIPGSSGGLVTADMDVVYSGTTPYEKFGTEVAGLGDIDGDGFADVGVGHPERSSRAGAAYVYRGTDGTIDDDGDGYFTSGSSADCDDTNAAVHPGAPEVCDGVDQDCDATIDEGVTTLYFRDTDGDGYGVATSTQAACAVPSGYATNSGDCDDTSAGSHPGAAELIGSGVDEDCDGLEACQGDADVDGYGTAATVASADMDCADPGEAVTTTDCDDTAAGVSPADTEVVADGIDQDCDGADVCYTDADVDGHGTATLVTAADLDCDDDGEAAVADDCDDTSATVYTGAAEVVADGIDQDCEGTETCYVDADGDGQGTYASILSPDLACDGPGESPAGGDCDDADGARFVGATETPADGVDADCDGQELCWADTDADGFGGDEPSASTALACDVPGVSAIIGDCDDAVATVYPGATEAVADGVDSDCDGTESCWTDADADGHGGTTPMPSDNFGCVAAGVSALSDDCDDTSAATFPGADELAADGVDQDCDGGDLCYTDADGDSFGGDTLVASANLSCAESGESNSAADCDDAAASSFPGAFESCNQLDDNCDGLIDEGLPDCQVVVGEDECGCASTSGSEGLASVVALASLALLRRRRRA